MKNRHCIVCVAYLDASRHVIGVLVRRQEGSEFSQTCKEAPWKDMYEKSTVCMNV